MPTYSRNDAAASDVLAWTAHAANAVEEEAAADADEPPDPNQHAAAHQPVTEHTFEKTTVHRPKDRVESLLTRALQSQSEDEVADRIPPSGLYPRRRRSITSNTSMASTAGFTSDTGITTPPRTNSPSPRLASLGLAPVNARVRSIDGAAPLDVCSKVDLTPKLKDVAKVQPPSAQAQAPQRKRCISFACGPMKPSRDSKTTPPPTENAIKTAPEPDDTPKAAYAQLVRPAAEPTQPPKAEPPAQPKRTCIRFACPARPSTAANKPQLSALKVDGQHENRKLQARKPSPAPELKSPTFARRLVRANSSGRSPRSVTRSSALRQPSNSPIATRCKKYYNAAPGDLNGESSRFHEFASDVPYDDDWIRNDKIIVKQRLTIDDTLKKELAIRRLGKEAEEEAEQEEEEEEDGEENDDENDAGGDEDDDDEEADNDEDGDEVDTVEGDQDRHRDDGFAGYSSGEDASDGYNTDNETGFASSDDEDDGLILWTINRPAHQHREHNFDNDHSTLNQNKGTPVFRRFSVDEHSDSSGFIAGHAVRQEKPKNRELANKIRRPATPELPDSTDFVCGTFDEDRPLEEAYLSHIEARKRGKLYVIPQDIDPSFPTSDPDDDGDRDLANAKQRTQQQKQQQQLGSAEDHIWVMEDIHHDHQQQDRADAGRQKKKAESPRRYRSPPPPKNRGRSPAPRRQADRLSPVRRLKSPAPKGKPMPTAQATRSPLVSPPALPVEVPGDRGRPVFQSIAFKPGLTQTTSLPRPSAIFRHPQLQQTTTGHAIPAKVPRRSKANGQGGAKQTRHVRGAIDIVKGLEQKRQRRKEKFQQKYCNRARKGHVPERRTQRGEGAERMREVGLLMAGKIPQGNYVLSI